MALVKKIAFVVNLAFVVVLIGCLPQSTINRSPVISVDFTYTVEVGDLSFNLVELVTIVDDNDGTIPVTSSMISYNNFNINIVGSYDVEITVRDSDNLQAEASVVINVVDTEKPVITLTGDEEITLTTGNIYNESGATCTDNYDASCEVVIDDSTLDINVAGTYTITYSVSDNSANEADVVTRTVIVEAVTIPVITLIGNSTVDVEVGFTYIDEGTTCTDSNSDPCTVVVDFSNVNTTVLGTYTVTFNATDDYNNDAIEVTRTVNVVDTTSPVITATGDLTIIIEVGDSYTDLGATCDDNYDDCIVVTTNEDIDTTILGTYTINYNAVDTSSNMAVEVIRTVIVEDSIAPQITMFGDETFYVDLDSTYLDLGASCTDNFDSECTVIVDTSSLDLTTLGTYSVTYNTSDTSGNDAIESVRTIIVQAPSDRHLGLLGDEVYYILKDAVWDGVSVFVSQDGDFSAFIIGTVDTSTVGTYRLQYRIEDELNHFAYFERIVHVVETIPELKEQVSLLNMYNHYMDLYLELVQYDDNNDFFLDSDETRDIIELDFESTPVEDVFYLAYFENPRSKLIDVN
ncbi:DUF5011 domain-containing protein, partial [Candidatus Izimaplasma bacterium]|nr:DUF5011 domain-containing protein [Candidatus Izimaplasma bacterium]